MTPDIKAKWVAELRSGQYERGIGFLRDEVDHYCCLGVLCNIFDPSAWEAAETPEGQPTDGWWYRHGEHKDEAILPGLLRNAIGISTETEEKLTSMNDRGSSFSEIADWIEENL